jgi:hypothetical protein
MDRYAPRKPSEMSNNPFCPDDYNSRHTPSSDFASLPGYTMPTNHVPVSDRSSSIPIIPNRVPPPVPPPHNSNRYYSRPPDETPSSVPPLSMNGLEHVPSSESVGEDGSVSDDRTIMSVKSDRNGDVQATYAKSMEIIQRIKEQSQLVEDVSQMMQRLEMAADRNFKRTYIRATPAKDLFEHAPIIKVGIVFLPGVDRPTVTKLEQALLMVDNQPDQMSASWRVNTAGHLLLDFEVCEDLSVRFNDLTSDVLQRSKQRREQTALFHPIQGGNVTEAIVIRDTKHPAVNIDSESVTLVHDLRNHSGKFDLEATLIEVDSSSMMSLIVGFRLIIQNRDPNQNLEETRKLLEEMMERIRRLCQRSAILFRMSTRVKIIHSKNTRYGVNNGRQFTTLTTSKGIKEIVSTSASYYSALDSAEKAQQFIRPRFLQMLILLLSFLNDEDLGQIKVFLEKTFHFKADRPNLELLFLKVIPFYSINEHVFLTSMVPAFEGWSPRKPENQDYSHYWETFLCRIVPYDYLLPGTLDQLGRKQKSWILEWPRHGFKSSLIFRNLQYGANDNMRTFNDIPPIEEELDRKDINMQLTAVLTNDGQYYVRLHDYEAIICLTKGVYDIQGAELGGSHCDLVIEEDVLNDDTYRARDHINPVIRKINQWLASFKSKNVSIGRRGSIRGALGNLGKFPTFSRPEIPMLKEYVVSGKLTRHRARLGNNILAIAYKLDGRKITLNDAIGILAQDNQEVQGIAEFYQARVPAYSSFIDSNSFGWIQSQISSTLMDFHNAESVRHTLQEDPAISDEPIVTLIQPPGGSYLAPKVWSPYKISLTAGGQLNIEAQKMYVARVIWGDEIEVTLENDSNRYIVAPLEYVEESEREEQIQEQDIALLVGQYMIVAEPEEEEGYNGLYMSNYLKVSRRNNLQFERHYFRKNADDTMQILRIEKGQNVSKRKARREQIIPHQGLSQFV